MAQAAGTPGIVGAKTRRLVLAAISAEASAAVCWLDPVPQDPGYHAFVDGRTLFGIPNFWNVVTNLPFLFIGLQGLAWRARLLSGTLLRHYAVFCVGGALVRFGSADY